MRRSVLFLPTMKETPTEAQIASHRLMLRAGMVRQSAAGIYSWLPLGFRVLRNIERIVREEQDRAGAQEMLMPTIQSAELWRRSGRYNDYGKEMLRIIDRGERELLYGPTNEELITDIFAGAVRSYRDLPKNLYHIQWKFRDEIRPRFGVMRGREFLMKDAYSFDMDKASAEQSYLKMFVAYLRTFARLGLRAVPVQADPGAIGGNMSHEFHILADTGESDLYFDAAFEDYTADQMLKADFGLVEDLRALYAVADEKHDAASCPVPQERLRQRKGIEVGHIFYFGTKYSAPMGASVTSSTGEQVNVEMGSYGIGVSRLVGAIIEASHDENGIIWPESVAPYKVALINLRHGDADCTAAADGLYEKFQNAGIDTLYDDRDERPGVKFADADLIGLPWQVTIGPRGVKAGVVEFKNRATGETQEITPEAALNRLGAKALMISAFEWMLAARYLRARRKDGFISLTAVLSVVGIVLGVATLIIVMSVMNGFQNTLINQLLGLRGHVLVQTAFTNPMRDFEPLVEKLRKIDGVKEARPIIEGQAMAVGLRQSAGVMIHGIRPADLARHDIGKLDSHGRNKIIAGSLQDFVPGDAVVLGTRLADTLGVRPGDTITLVSPQTTATPFGSAPRMRDYTVVAVFSVGNVLFDSTYIFMPFEDAQTYFRQKDEASEIEVVLDDPRAINAAMPRIQAVVGDGYRLISWESLNAGLVSALKVERNVMFVILVLIILVAAFNIMSSLIMLVKDKGRDIAVLRTIGASKRSVMKVFILCGGLLGVSGTIIGFLLGVTLLTFRNQILGGLGDLLNTTFFPPEVYGIDGLPAMVDPVEVGVVTGIAMLLSLLMTVYPAWRAASLDPVEALRYE